MQKITILATYQKESFPVNNVKLQILYDNNSYVEDLQTDPGFSCLIKIENRTLLFDAGRIGKILVSNIEKLEINPEDIEKIVISHNHSDHICGLPVHLEECIGEAYVINKNKELAIKNYKKSLKLNPNNTNAKEMLKKLKK